MSRGEKILWAAALTVGAGCVAAALSSCATAEDRGMTARTALGVVRILCPPEITVGDCLAKVEAFLPPEPSDAGAE